MPKGIYPRRKNFTDKFWSRVNKNGTDHAKLGACWEFGTPPNGYGKLRGKSGAVMAHRYSWEVHYGPIPDGLDVLHKCDNPSCVRPSHLFLGNDIDNNRDMRKKGRAASCKGEANGNRKLSDAEVAEIRRRFVRRSQRRTNMAALAREFGITRTMIGYIIRRQYWTHLD